MNKTAQLILCLFLTVNFRSVAQSQTPTWSKDIASILYKNCTSCHHQGALAPNPLMTYQQAYNYRYLLNQYVQDNVMPPWPPDAGYTRLAHERVVSAEDKKRIADWVNAGGPEGNTSDAPNPPVYSQIVSQLTGIDYSARMPDYLVNTANDLYRCFVINTNFPADVYASEIEVIPGNPKIVHHVLVYEDTSAVIVQKDSADAGVGYTSFFGTGSDDSQLIGEWVPGTSAIKFPAGMGMRLKQGTRIILQIHYPKGTYLELDSTRVNIKFTSGNPIREVILAPVLNEGQLVNGPLVIPAETVKSFTETYVAPADPQLPFAAYTVLSVAPHMHLIGKKIKTYAIPPNGGDTIPMVRINNWDFKWQGIYNFRKPLKIVPGTTLVAEASYDNTSGNPSNPNSPPITVVQGEATTEEMMLVFFAFTYYLPGDENILIDGSPIVGLREANDNPAFSLFDIYPNPSGNSATLRCFSLNFHECLFEISDSRGAIVKKWSGKMQGGDNFFELNLTGLESGQYFITVKTESQIRTKAIIHE